MNWRCWFSAGLDRPFSRPRFGPFTPIGTEAVTSIVGRADLLAAMAVLGGLLLYAWSATHPSRGYVTAVALFGIATLGVFAKENAAVLLGLMLLWDLAFGDGLATVRSRWPNYAAVTAALAVLALVRYVVLGGLPMAQRVYVDNPMWGADFWTARFTAVKVIGLDLSLLLWPAGLSCDRSYSQIPLSGTGDVWAWLSLLIVLAMVAAALFRYRQDRLTFWLAGFFGIALLPTANLLVPIGAVMAERFLYLPSVAFAMAAVALFYRLKDSRHTVAVLSVLLVACAGRTLARNPAWNSDLTLASSDLQTAPRSFRLHDMLAKALFEEDPARNIDRAIAEEEKSWEILEPLPPARSNEFPPTFLGIYYGVKASLAGPEQGRAWYLKSAAVLERARTISQALEKAYDGDQRAHGKPVTARSGFQQLYFNLANAYLNLGRFAEALEALRYGRGLDPRALESYDGMKIAYASMGHPEQAALALLEKAQIEGPQPATLAEIRDAYQKFPDGGCAVIQQDAGLQLNTECPRIKSDLCLAWSDLEQAYQEARQPGAAAELRNLRVRSGCR